MRLIDADLLIKQLKTIKVRSEYLTIDYKRGHSDGIETAVEWAAEMPTAEPQRVRGEWLTEVKSKFSYDKCSVCGFSKPSFLDFRNYDFCPVCGADMRGENNG